MNTYWTESEIQYLTIHASTMNVNQLSDELEGRSSSGVRNKLQRIGINAKADPTRQCGVQLRVKKSSPLWRG